MAAVLPPSSVHSSSHLLAPHRDTFGAFHQHRGSAPALQSHRKPFNAFAPHHHSSANSRSEAASWRHSDSEPQAVVRQPAPVPTPSPKYRRPSPSHSRPLSTSSEASSTSWRSHGRSPATTKADVAEERSGPHRDELKASSPFVYSAAELLRLSASPLVGISKESQDVVNDLVAHYVWRRGAQSGTTRTGRRRNKRGTSKPQSSHTSTSTDDSEQSD